MVLLIY